MRRTLRLFSYVVLVGVYVMGSAFILSPKAKAASMPNLIIDDVVFNDYTSMTSTQIDAFLNSFASSCISTNNGFSSPDVTGYNPSQGFTYGSNVSAGAIIYHAAQAYELNPKAILATLQKEQTLVTGELGCHPEYQGDAPQFYSWAQNSSCTGVGSPYPDCANVTCGRNTTYSDCSYACKYNGCIQVAVGYDCPGFCKKNSAGFSKQIIKATWFLKFVQQRSLGNYNWNIQKPGWDNSDDPLTPYDDGPMTQGTLKRCASCTATYYDGWTTINGQSVHMDSGATVALYRYTPFQSGNQKFVNIFEGWFGGTVSAQYYTCHNASNLASTPGGGHLVANKFTNKTTDNLSLVFLNNTGSACIEMHTWSDSSYQNWMQNIASNHPSVSPADDEVIAADTNGDGIDEFYLIKLRNSSSGKIEVHQWDSTKQHWASNLATNHPSVDPADDAVIAGDINGDGKDELMLIKYRHTASGKIEVHTWNPGYQSWYSNIATNHPAVDPADARIITANTLTDGDRIDKLILVKYKNSVSGKIEVHTWYPGYQSWYSNIATNHPAVDPADDEVIAGSTTGNGKDNLMLIKYRNSVSGKIEVHTWGFNEQSWYSNIATNLPTIAP